MHNHAHSLSHPWIVFASYTQVMEGCGQSSVELIELYPLFLRALEDPENEVASNAAYGLGVLAANALPDMAA